MTIRMRGLAAGGIATLLILGVSAEAEETRARSSRGGVKTKSVIAEQLEMLDTIRANQDAIHQKLDLVMEELRIVKIRATSKTPRSACD